MVKKKASKNEAIKPKQERSRDTFETILKAATRILGKEGPEGLNTNLVAQVAGVSVGSLYQYFRNKDSIVQELLERVLDSGVERVLKVLETDRTPREVVTELVKTALSNMDKQGPATLYILEAAPRLISTKRFQQVDAMIIPKVLAKAKEQGIQLRPLNPEVALFICIQTMRAAGWTLVRDKGQRYSREEIERELTDLLCRYLLLDEAK